MIITHQETKEALFGTFLEGEKAIKKRSNIMKTGTRRSNKGGGGRGGITNGRIKMDKAKRDKIKTEYLNMHPLLLVFSFEATFVFTIIIVEPHLHKTTLRINQEP